MTQSPRNRPEPDPNQPRANSTENADNGSNGRRGAAANNTPNTSNKKRWVEKVSLGLKTVFKTLQDVIRLIGESFHHIMHTGSYLFGTVFGVSVSPIVQIFVAIAALTLVLWVTFHQWWDIGVWVAKLAHYNGYLGGVTGVVFGVGINLKQVAPSSWKLSKALALVFSNLRVNPNYEPSDPNSPRELHDNWHSANHRSIKIQSQFAFLIECLIVSFYVVAATRINAYAVIVAAISLKLPETTLLWTAHTISLFGEVTNQTVQNPDDNQPKHRY